MHRNIVQARGETWISRIKAVGDRFRGDVGVERLQREYWDLMRPCDLKVDRNGINLVPFKIAAVLERNVPLCYVWVREPIFKFKVGIFMSLYPRLYEACAKTSPARWKCEILPFRGTVALSQSR